jgi:hypothetical protein
MSVPRHVRASPLLHPLPLAAAAVLLVNDHLLKPAAWPSAAVAGKLSDLAGLFLFPVLATALTHRRLASAWVLATGVAFTALKLSPGFNRAVELVWGGNALDPSDLVALPALALSWLYLQRGHAPAGALPRAAATTFIALACAATPAPRYQRAYPFWEVTGNAAPVLGCAEAAAWVVKSGKTGFGLTVRLHATAGACRVDLASASLRLADGTVVRGVAARRHLDLARCQVEHVYVPFLFDSEAAWNLGVRSGTIELALATDLARHEWRLPAEHRLHAYQQLRASPPPATPPLSACAPEAPAQEIAK